MRDTAASLSTSGTLVTDPTYATLDYALTDRNFSVIGTGFTGNQVGDRVRYDPYGTFQAFPAGDVNYDGTVDSADTNAFIFAASYQADLDLTLNGLVGAADQAVVTANLGRSFAPNQLSDRGNIVGWCGELYEESTGIWLARHRWPIPELGRWANRDPISSGASGRRWWVCATRVAF